MKNRYMNQTVWMCILSLFVFFNACAKQTNRIDPHPAYQEAVEKLRVYIEHEMEDKELPSFSMVLVDNQDIVWAEGFGLEDPETGKPATAQTVYRIGSVSKLFTDIGIMQLVEKGEIDLDSPVTNYLPRFQPRNPYNRPITLRQLMSHRSGLLRESRVGNYFDDTGPSLAQTVESIANSELIYEPETKIKYSNAGITVVGYTLEYLNNRPFASYLKEAVLNPMGLKNGAFEPTPFVKRNLARAFMWSYDGRRFQAPTFELGMAPAGCMYVPITDLGLFMTVMFNDGKGLKGQVLRQETLEEMWTPQFGSGPNQGYGIGFGISEQSGYKRVGHGGAIYGFATQLYMLPELKLGAASATSVDVSNSVTRRITAYALDLMIAVREKKPLPDFTQTQSVDSLLAVSLEGSYKSNSELIKLVERYGDLTIHRGFIQARVRALGDTLIVDDRQSYGTRIVPLDSDHVEVAGTLFERIEDHKPGDIPEKWKGLIGEYGWDHNILFIYEDRGKLYTLIEWFDKYPLEEVKENTFLFPERGGMYHGEKLQFTRDNSGQAIKVEITNGVVFKRREVGAEQISPVESIDKLKKTAKQAVPPRQSMELRRSELVELASLDPIFEYDIRYATTNNFMGMIFYEEPRAFMQKPAAEALIRVHRKLKEKGYGLLIHDAYRPWYVTKMFWDATPEDKKIFVANPENGSRHNRGCAVDLTLYDLNSGGVVEMVGGYDEFSERSFADYVGGTSLQRWHRDLLRDAMESEGFRVYEHEWWHFDYRDWNKYPVQNLRFEEILFY